MARGAVGRTGSANPQSPSELEVKIVLLARQRPGSEARSGYAEHAQPLGRHGCDLGLEGSLLVGRRVTEVGDRLRRSFGGDDELMPVG